MWENTVYVTAEELAAITDEVNAVFDRFRHRLDDPSSRPEGSRPIEAVLFDHPLMFPGEQSPGPDDQVS